MIEDLLVRKMLDAWAHWGGSISQCRIDFVRLEINSLSNKGYPLPSNLTYFETQFNRTLCDYRNSVAEGQGHSSLSFYVTEDAITTASASCFKSPFWNAFNVDYSGRAAIRRYMMNYPAPCRPWYLFVDHPPPNNTGLDPLRGLRCSLGDALSDLQSAIRNIREAERRTIFSFNTLNAKEVADQSAL
ncbi:hypothetical protein FOZ60_007798 [Perkinsus olseni]|uniref:Uncharacterized protein n=1 Tax=Perkinsus olseni TaxID=32597 RepID=A0A7J6PEC8_PEROL|nr:hypothetical protein FOZ60_007798 [Perkinsus olseni]